MSHSEVKCDMGIERGEIGLCIPRKIWVTVSKFEEFYVQKFDRCRVKHLSDRVELSTREWMLNQASYRHRKSPYTWVVADWPWNKQWPPYISTHAAPPSAGVWNANMGDLWLLMVSLLPSPVLSSQLQRPPWRNRDTFSFDPTSYFAVSRCCCKPLQCNTFLHYDCLHRKATIGFKTW